MLKMYIETYICDVCGTKMDQWHNFNDHWLKVHGEKLASIAVYRKLVFYLTDIFVFLMYSFIKNVLYCSLSI